MSIINTMIIIIIIIIIFIIVLIIDISQYASTLFSFFLSSFRPHLLLACVITLPETSTHSYLCFFVRCKSGVYSRAGNINDRRRWKGSINLYEYPNRKKNAHTPETEK
uniref:Uncharacterized protein n=1 Tax=Schizaphis graminum TaxID=13262 RepID=A0A2S2PKN0_SCHGA